MKKRRSGLLVGMAAIMIAVALSVCALADFTVGKTMTEAFQGVTW